MGKDWHPNVYQSMVLSSNNLANKDLNLESENNTMIKWNHTITPMRKSTWERLFDRHQETIEKSCSAFRRPKNITQELVNSWHYLSEQYNKDYTLKANYINISVIKNKDSLYKVMKDCQVICINDGNIDKDALPFEDVKKIILNTFEELFPEKSKYEIV